MSFFAPGAITPTATLTGLDSPYGLVLDAAGNLYVANLQNSTISKFAPAYTINDGNNGNNYTVTLVSNTTGVITKASLTIKATTNTKNWDGSTIALATPTVSGLVSGDAVTFPTGPAEVYSDALVGTGKTLSLTTYTINDGNSGQNYTIATGLDKTGVINPPVSILTLPASEAVIEPPQGMTYTIQIKVTVNQPLDYTLTYQTVNGSAVAGTDFVGVSSAVVHIRNAPSDPNPQNFAMIPVTILGDAPQQPGGLAVESFAVNLLYSASAGAGNSFTQTEKASSTINIGQVFAPKISIAANQQGGPYVQLTSYYTPGNINPNFTAAQYAQAAGDVYLNYNTMLGGVLFSSATIKIAASSFVTGSSTFKIPNFKIPSKPPSGMLTMTLAAVTTNAAIDATANTGVVGYP